jgi:NADPH:quinone reductase-like Zn-dependent oxidoreductase
VFDERKLEHLDVTVRVCGYQPQGVPSLRGHPLPQKIEPLDSQLGGTQLLSFMAVKKIKRIVDSVFPLKNTAAAQHHLEEAKQFGKVVLQILG